MSFFTNNNTGTGGQTGTGTGGGSLFGGGGGSTGAANIFGNTGS